MRFMERGYLGLSHCWSFKLLPHAKYYWNRATGCRVMGKNDCQYIGRPPSGIL